MNVDPCKARGHGGTGGRRHLHAGSEKGGVRARDQVLFAWEGKEGQVTGVIGEGREYGTDACQLFVGVPGTVHGIV